MIQDIFPSKLDNHYEAFSPRPEDTLVFCDSDGRLLVNTDGGRVHFPVGGDAAGGTTSDAVAAVYLFSLDGERYFSAGGRCADRKGGLCVPDPSGNPRSVCRQGGVCGIYRVSSVAVVPRQSFLRTVRRGACSQCRRARAAVPCLRQHHLPAHQSCGDRRRDEG